MQRQIVVLDMPAAYRFWIQLDPVHRARPVEPLAARAAVRFRGAPCSS